MMPPGMRTRPVEASKAPRAVERFSTSDKSETKDFCEASIKALNNPYKGKIKRRAKNELANKNPAKVAAKRT